MRGVLGLRVPAKTPDPPAAPSIARCQGVQASWPEYAGAESYELQWATGTTASPTTIVGATSPRLIVGYDAQLGGVDYYVRIRAIFPNGRPTPWSPWARTTKLGEPYPLTAALSSGITPTFAAPGATETEGGLVVASQYDIEVQYAAGVAPPASDAGWSTVATITAQSATAATVHTAAATGWYRARMRWRGTKCGDGWYGPWGPWGTAVYSGPVGGGDAGGELGDP